MSNIFRRNQRAELANDVEERRAPRSQPQTPTAPRAHNTYGTAMKRKESPARSELDGQDRSCESSNQLERKTLPDIPVDSGGFELGLMEQAGDDSDIDDDYGVHDDNEVLKLNNASLTEKLHQTAMELNRLRSQKTYERDDAFFMGEFKTLRYKVMDWAVKNFSGGMSQSMRGLFSTSNPFSTSIDEMVELAIDDSLAKGFLYSAQSCPLMIEAFVWKFIVTRVMGNDGYIWAGKLKDSFASIRGELDPTRYRSTTDEELRQYHLWRSSTAGIIQERLSNELRYREQLVGKHAKDLGKKLKEYCQSSAAQLQRELMDIVGDAARLDAEMGKQRALYIVCMPPVRPQLRFNQGWMAPAIEDPRTAKDQADEVGIVVRPALMRYGTSSGQDYKRGTCLICMDVWLQHVEEEPARSSRGESRHGQRLEQARAREQGRPREGGPRRAASMDVGRPRAPEGGEWAVVPRRPVQDNKSTTGNAADAGPASAKGTWNRRQFG